MSEDIHIPFEELKPPTVFERFAAHAFEALIAFMCVMAGVAFFADPRPNNNAVAQVYENFPWMADTFSLMVLAAGIMIIVGLGTLKINIHIAGLFLLCGAVCIQGIALVAVLGVRGLFTTIAIYGGVVTACGVRTWLLLSGRALRLVKVDLRATKEGRE